MPGSDAGLALRRSKKTPPGSGVLHGLLLLSRIRFLSQRRRDGFYCFSTVRCFYFLFCFLFFFLILRLLASMSVVRCRTLHPLVETFFVRRRQIARAVPPVVLVSQNIRLRIGRRFLPADCGEFCKQIRRSRSRQAADTTRPGLLKSLRARGIVVNF